jgi:3-oxoacyl-[acyl-carrier protein] reductase
MVLLANKTAIVTGATKGIGFAIARALVAAGVNVSISARNEGAVKMAVADLNELGDGVVLVLSATFATKRK